MEAFQIRHQEITADRITGSDVKLSSAYADIEKLALPTLDQADRRFDMAQKNLSFGSKTYFLGAWKLPKSLRWKLHSKILYITHS